MSSSSLIVVNVTGADIVLHDLKGLVLVAGEETNLLQFGTDEYKTSNQLISEISLEHVEVFNGQHRVTGIEGVDFIRVGNKQLTRDGKEISVSSDRPRDHYRFFTGYDDNLTTGKIGGGKPLLFNVLPNASQSLLLDFVDDIYLRDGIVYVHDSTPDSECTLCIAVVAPAGIPFPSPTKTGTLDLVNGAFVPNGDGTGAYMTAPVEVALHRLLNKMWLHEFDNAISTPEPMLLPRIYKVKATIINNSDVAMKACLTMGLYRKNTV